MDMGEMNTISDVPAANGSHSDSDASESAKLSQERQNIVNKYIKGIGRDEESDMLGDAEFTDQYGFVLKAEPLPLPKQEEERRKLNEVKRRTKWLKMVRHWDKYSGTDKLGKRVYKGIPQSMRGDVWKLLLQVYQYMQNGPAVYKEMKTRAHSHSTDIRQIDLDVNRTYRDHEMFRKRYSIKQQELFHVLAAYSMYNTEVGYCQGMSQIAALLLMYMSEEEAFWALHSLLYGERHKMHGFFIPGFPKLIRFQEHHDRVLKKLMPKLKKHFDENEVYASLYTMKWFFQCFLDRSPFSLTLRLWDIYVLEGEKLLVCMSYATLKMHKGYLKNQDMDGIVSFLQEQLVKDFGAPDDSVVEHLKECMTELRKFHMDLPPSAHAMENPKLPFGTFVPTDDTGKTKVPDIFLHTVPIDTLLPGLQRTDSWRKRRKNVNRGKSDVGKTTKANGIDQASKLPAIKEAKSTKDQEKFSRSPASRGSKKSTKPERSKPAKSATPRSTPKRENKKENLSTHDSTPNAHGSRKSPARKHEESPIPNINDRPGHKRNGTAVNNKQINRPDAFETMPTSSEPESDNTTANYSYLSNNSNNSNISSKPKKTRNHKTEPFVPPILSHLSSSSYDTYSTDSNSSPTRKGVPNWKVPSDAKSKTNIKTSSSTLHLKTGVTHQHNDPAAYNSLAPYSQTMIRKKSQSTDLLKEPGYSTLKMKTPSFSQLSPAVDAISSASQQNSPISSSTSGTGSRTAPLKHKNRSARPISYYDNVPVDSYNVERKDGPAQVSGKKEVGVEASSRLMTKPMDAKKKARGGRHAKSMGDLQKSTEANRKKKHLTARDNEIQGTQGVSSRRKRSTGSQNSIIDESMHHLRNTPFQNAILASGILDPPKVATRGRRMSREEIVTAAVLSQLEPKSRRDYPIRKPRRSANNVNDSVMKKSKSAVTLAKNEVYTDWHRARKKSMDAEKIILPRIIQGYGPTSGDQLPGLSMEKNWSLDGLEKSSEKSWGTTELDRVSATPITSSMINPEPKPLHSKQASPPSDTMRESILALHSSSPARHPSQDVYSAHRFPNANVASLYFVPSLSQLRDNGSFQAIPPDSEINQLLSAGINADSSVLRRYDMTRPHAEQRVLAAPYHNSRRRSVNMAVQTDESRVS